MHLDEEAARQSLVGGLCASGWHTCAIMMRIVADGFYSGFLVDGRHRLRGDQVARRRCGRATAARAHGGARHARLGEPARHGFVNARLACSMPTACA